MSTERDNDRPVEPWHVFAEGEEDCAFADKASAARHMRELVRDFGFERSSVVIVEFATMAQLQRYHDLQGSDCDLRCAMEAIKQQ